MITSITIVLEGIYIKVTTISLISPSHFTFLESKEYKSLYGLVTSNPKISTTPFGIKLWEAPELDLGKRGEVHPHLHFQF